MTLKKNELLRRLTGIVKIETDLAQIALEAAEGERRNYEKISKTRQEEADQMIEAADTYLLSALRENEHQAFHPSLYSDKITATFEMRKQASRARLHHDRALRNLSAAIEKCVNARTKYLTSRMRAKSIQIAFDTQTRRDTITRSRQNEESAMDTFAASTVSLKGTY